MAIYDAGTASLAANGTVTGVGTTWQAPLTLIRVGATIVFKTEPVKIYTISEIISDTQINVYNPNSETVPAGTGYAILAHDGITVQGLAQDVAETLRYYQSNETEVSKAVDVFANFDADAFDTKVTQVNTQHSEVVTIGAQVANDAIQTSSDRISASESAEESRLSSVSSMEYANQSIAAANSVSGALVFSFESGGTVESPNQQVFFNDSGSVSSYVWLGQLPKEVPAVSSPSSTGGIGSDSWALVSGGVVYISGLEYKYEESINIQSDGISSSDGNLYLTSNSRSYRLLSDVDLFVWPGDYLHGLSDGKSSIEAVMSLGMNVCLNGYTVTVSTLDMTKDLVNGTIKAAADVGTLINVNSCRLYNAKVDCDNKAVRRVVYIRPGSVNGTAKKVEIFNSTGATNANGVFVDANNAQGFLVDDVFIHNLTSVGNDSIGDAVGPCRGILVGTALDPAPTASTVSSGEINNIRIRDLAPFEDCDGVVVQIYDASSVMLSAAKIRVKNIDTHNVRKRAVKIQANDVTVSNVYAYCDTQDTAMYSIVSLYGNNGSAFNVNGRGRILNGVDCAYGFNNVSNLYLKSARVGSDTLSGIGAGLLINSGQVDAVNIYSEGAEYVVAIRDALGDTPYIKISGLRGQGYSGVVRFQIRAGNNIGSVYIDDVSATSSATNKASFSIDATSGLISLINISNVIRLSQPFTGANININGNVSEAIISDCIFKGDSSSVGIAMTTGKLTARNISAPEKVYAVQAIQTSGSVINNVDGVVRLQDTTNSMTSCYTSLSTSGTNTGSKTVNYS